MKMTKCACIRRLNSFLYVLKKIKTCADYKDLLTMFEMWLKQWNISLLGQKILKGKWENVFQKSSLTLSQRTNFRLFQLKEFADDNFKFDENGTKFSK